MRSSSLVFLGLLFACGGVARHSSDDGSSGDSCKSLFRRWDNASCPTSAGCLNPLNFSGGEFGTNTLTITLSDGAVCTYDVVLNSNGSDTTSGTGSIENGHISGSYTQNDFAQCSAFNGASFTWALSCDSLAITDAAGTATYQ